MKHLTLALIQRYSICLFILSACSTNPPRPITAETTENNVLPSQYELVGRVVDDSGQPVKQANIKTNSTVALTDNNGWFHIPSNQPAQWITVYKAGFIPRTRAASPGNPVLIRVSPDDGRTIVLKFTGDVMFGRRFFDTNADGDPEDGLLPVNPSIQDHLNLLGPIAPLLGNSDITAINLESVLADTPYFSLTAPRPTTFQPTKDYVYATHSDALAALMNTGVNMIGLGNNHVYDMLDPGMANTIKILNNLGLPHFGAGLNEAEAWTPAVVTVKGKRIAFIGCTVIFASTATPKPDEITYTASDALRKGGAAHCDYKKLIATVTAAQKASDMVIVMIHGGVEYDRIIPKGPTRLTEIAEQAGATIVINHHTHVVSGFSWNNGKIVARSLGNFISDQLIWPSLESYMFTIYVRDGKIIRAFIEPVLLEENVARGIAGELAGYVARDAGGLEAGPFVMESDTMEVDVDHHSKQVSKSVDLDGGSGTLIQIPDGQWLSKFSGSGTLQLGRDVLWVGGFENTVVDGASGSLPLWSQDNISSFDVGPQFAYQGQAGIRLSRNDTSTVDAVTTSLHRIPVQPQSQITISGMFRGSSGAAPSVQVSWYTDLLGPSSSQIVTPLKVDNSGVWQSFQVDAEVPANASAVQVFLKLSPPKTGLVTTDFDNLRIINWAPADSEYSPLYDFAYLIGKGKLTFSQSVLPGGEPWLTISNLDISKIITKQTP